MGSSVGSYTDSPGMEIIRRHVAEYISERDGSPADWRNVMLCAGASEGIRAVMKLMTNPEGASTKKPGVMIPIPQYPLYSASLAEYNMEQVGYYLDESRNWALDVKELERSIKEAKTRCKVRAIVIINPGNPTGQVLTRENIEAVIRFAQKEKLFIFADEVYQHNVYAELCPTVLGQSCMDIVANPPKPGEPSYNSWLQEKEGNLASLARRADLVATTLNTIP